MTTKMLRWRLIQAKKAAAIHFELAHQPTMNPRLPRTLGKGSKSDRMTLNLDIFCPVRIASLLEQVNEATLATILCMSFGVLLHSNGPVKLATDAGSAKPETANRIA